VEVDARVRGEGGRGLLWSDTLTIERRGVLNSGVVNVPVSRIGVGVATLVLNRLGSADSVSTPIFVSFGEDLPIASFADMINYLRYFAPAQRLAVLQNAKIEDRAGEWARFLRETDPDPSTGQHEGLNAYFLRIAQANSRFREEGTAGWLSDRGRVFVALGNPDQVYEPNANDVNQRGRSQIWDYQRFRLRLVFTDQSGFGRWRLSTSSENDFEAVVKRELGRTGGAGAAPRP
jgi:GWxTD domain-containing protein